MGVTITDAGRPERAPLPRDAAAFDSVERLAMAIERASAAGQWAIVELLGRQLEALTRAHAGNVVDIAGWGRR